MPERVPDNERLSLAGASCTEPCLPRSKPRTVSRTPPFRANQRHTLEQDFVHVTRTSSAGWVVVGLGGSRSRLYLSRFDALEHAARKATEIAAVVGYPIGIRIQDERGRWGTLSDTTPAPPAVPHAPPAGRAEDWLGGAGIA